MNRHRAQLSFSQVIDVNQNLPLTHADAEVLHIGDCPRQFLPYRGSSGRLDGHEVVSIE
ncbi:MAG: hypothetical protein ACI90G_000653 [Urechidicola sp.]|jgi:hypothetical protein